MNVQNMHIFMRRQFRCPHRCVGSSGSASGSHLLGSGPMTLMHSQSPSIGPGSPLCSRDRSSVRIHARCAISRDALYPSSMSLGRPGPMIVPAGPRASGRRMSTGLRLAIACCGRCTCRIFPKFRGKHPPDTSQNGGLPPWTPAPIHLPKWSIILPSRARSPPHHLFNTHTSVGTVYCPR